MTKNKMEIDLDLGIEDLQKSVKSQMDEDNEIEVDTSDDKENSNDVEIETVDEDTEEDHRGDSSEDNKEDTKEDTSSKDVNKKDTSEKNTKDENPQQQEEDDDEGEEKPKKHERFNKRVRQLVQEKKDAEAYAQRLAQEKDAENEELKKRLYEAEKYRVLSQKQAITSTIESLKKDFRTAAADNDYDKQAEINAELAKFGSQLATVEGLEKRYSSEYKPEARKQIELPNRITFDEAKARELSQEWEFDNPRVLTDKTFNETATKLGQMLMQRGFKPDTEEFYTELSSRMDKAYGITTQPKKNTSVKDDFEDEEEVKPSKKVETKPIKKPAPQAVSGASRTPSPTGSSAGGAKVRLTEKDQETARNLGQDLKTYAKNRLKVEQAMDERGRISVELF